MKKVIPAWILVLVMILSLVACDVQGTGNNGGDGNVGGDETTATPPTATGTRTEADEYYYAGGLHKITVTATDTTFVSAAGETEWRIVISTDPGAGAAANYIRMYVKEATGAELDVIFESETEARSAHDIVIGSDELFAAAGLTMPEDDIKENGFYIQSAGGNVYIMANADNGLRNGGIHFLRHVIGFEYVASESYSLAVTPGTRVTMPDMTIIETPDIRWSASGNNAPTDQKLMLSVNETSDFMMQSAGGAFHNSLGWFPIDQYAAEHPGWYSADKRELCYTAHGDAEELDLMAETAAQVAFTAILEHPDKDTVFMGVMDGGYYCDCDACTASHEAYGMDSAAVVKFYNMIDDKLRVLIAAYEEENDVELGEKWFGFMAYNQLSQPPVKKDADGNWVPIDDSVKLNDHVCVYYAAISSKVTQSLYSEDNVTVHDYFEGWRVSTNKLIVWYYDTNFFQYLYPLNTWAALPGTYRLFATSHAQAIFNQGQFDQAGGNTGFTVLKEYINAKLHWNVNYSYAELLDAFFPAYFGPASDVMRTYFEQLSTYLTYLEQEYPAQLTGRIYCNAYADGKYWPKQLLETYLSYIDEAYAAIEDLKVTNPDKYEVYRKNICRESIFPRFAMISSYSGLFTETVLHEMQVSFKADCAELGITKVKEGTSLDATFESWGL